MNNFEKRVSDADAISIKRKKLAANDGEQYVVQTPKGYRKNGSDKYTDDLQKAEHYTLSTIKSNLKYEFLNPETKLLTVVSVIKAAKKQTDELRLYTISDPSWLPEYPLFDIWNKCKSRFSHAARSKLQTKLDQIHSDEK